MPFEMKVLVSTLIVVLGGMILFFVDRGDKGLGDSSYWRGGSDDPYRKIILRSDGRMRDYVKPIAVFLFLLFIVALWTLT